MAELLKYKCPSCGGALEFSSELQKMKCPYCDTEFDVEAVRSTDSEEFTVEDNMQWDTSADDSQWQDGETDGLASYLCESCGGEIVCDITTAATHCPYCDSPIIMRGNLSGVLRPEIIIPFKLDKKAAKEALKHHLKGKKLLPRVFTDENHIDEIKGIYVPFWIFDSDATARIRYRGTRVRTYSDSDYIYTETSHYSIVRGGRIAFENIPADGSSKMPDDLMESIEPFDTSDAVPFETAYLSGYLADKYDVSAENSIGRINERVRNSTEAEFASTVIGYTGVTRENAAINLKNGRARYGLLPVWILNTNWNGERFTFAMNGQTGKFVGDLPCDKSLYLKWWFTYGGIASVIAFLVAILFFR